MREEEIGERWPEIPEWADPRELDAEVRRDLRGLSKEGSEFVGAHLFMAGMLAEEDPALAWRHARAARSKGGRIAVVRETVGLVAYHAGEWAEAISELRAARRMTGGPGQLPVMADCERALGHPEKAIELSRSAEATDLDPSSAAELRIVVAGARADLGQLDAALAHLAGALQPDNIQPYSARLFYAYADLLSQAGRRAEALDWFLKAAEADADDETGAGERLTELAGELGDGESDEVEAAGESESVFDEDDVISADAAGDGETSRDDIEDGDEQDDSAWDGSGQVDVTPADVEQYPVDRDGGRAQTDYDDGLSDAENEPAGIEANAAAGDDDDERYSANDMDADDDTDDSPIRPAGAPRSLGSLFSHNEGGL